jgi:hypothetical protein
MTAVVAVIYGATCPVLPMPLLHHTLQPTCGIQRQRKHLKEHKRVHIVALVSSLHHSCRVNVPSKAVGPPDYYYLQRYEHT